MFSRPSSSVRAISRLTRPSPSSIPHSRPLAATLPNTFRSYSASTSEEAGTVTSEGTKAEDSAESEKVKALESKVQELEKDRRYKQAEIQTLSRRIDEERRKASEFAISKFALSLLSTSDVLSTALSHVPKPVDSGTPLAALVSGVELTQKALWKTFEQNGVVKMSIKRGEGFDPNLHEATFQIPKEVAGPKGAEGGEWGAGEVVEVGKEGWMIGSRVLRPAQVGVTQIE